MLATPQHPDIRLLILHFLFVCLLCVRALGNSWERLPHREGAGGVPDDTHAAAHGDQAHAQGECPAIYRALTPLRLLLLLPRRRVVVVRFLVRPVSWSNHGLSYSWHVFCACACACACSCSCPSLLALHCVQSTFTPADKGDPGLRLIVRACRNSAFPRL